MLAVYWIDSTTGISAAKLFTMAVWSGLIYNIQNGNVIRSVSVTSPHMIVKWQYIKGLSLSSGGSRVLVSYFLQDVLRITLVYNKVCVHHRFVAGSVEAPELLPSVHRYIAKPVAF